MTIDQIVKQCHQQMDKTQEYLEREMRGLRTGRATTALIDYVKVNAYGSAMDLKGLAVISVPEPTQLLVKPFDPSMKSEIIKAIETADLGLNPMSDGNQIRINVPSPSAERRKQLTTQVRKMGEDAKVAIRNERRDAKELIDEAKKDGDCSEDDAKKAHEKVQKETDEGVKQIDLIVAAKEKDVMQI